jgi:hypothetical protein
MDVLEQTLYTNDTSIIHVEAQKCHWTESVGWTEFDFIKVFLVAPCLDYRMNQVWLHQSLLGWSLHYMIILVGLNNWILHSYVVHSLFLCSDNYY